MADNELLNRLQRGAFDYFTQNVNPANGLVADTAREGAPCSIACVGLALSLYPVAVERGWMSRADAIARTLTTLKFFHDSEQSEKPNVTGYRGFYYHFLDMKSGLRTWNCELSLIDTALLVAGMLTAALYFTKDTDDEPKIRDLADNLYQRIDWVWAQNGTPTLSQGWTPEFGFMHRGWDGYNEAAILYLLGVASPTYPLPADAYRAWTITYQWENIYGRDVLYAGPLFIHQFSHAWIDFRGIQDEFMREKNSDYFVNSINATQIQRTYAEYNPLSFRGYGSNCWGFSAGDGPGNQLLKIDPRDRRWFVYVARGAPFGPDDGTISPSATLASLPFSPDIVMPAIEHMLKEYPDILKNNQIAGGINPTALLDNGQYWVSESVFGLDQGMVALMIENHRSNFIWNLWRKSPVLRSGLTKAGFLGGWLGDSK